MGFDDQLSDAMPRGYMAAFRLLHDRDAARDACQEAARKALRARRRYDPARPFYPWFYRILKNHCLDVLKRRRPVAEHTDLGLAATTPSAEAEALAFERQRLVSKAIASLPQDLREIIELRHFQDLSYRDIATILDCPEGTVMSRLYRARKALREKLLRASGWSDLTGGHA